MSGFWRKPQLHLAKNLDIFFHFLIIIRPFCFSLTKPASFADCVGDELPMGWEQVLDPSRGVYYVNHGESKSEKETNDI